MRIAFVLSTAAFFVSHRLPIALAAVNKGHTVAIFVGLGDNEKNEQKALNALRDTGIDVYRVNYKTSTSHPLYEFFNLILLWIKLSKFRPNLLHCVSPKGIFYGAILMNFLNIKTIVLAFSGMGYLFTKRKNYSFSMYFTKAAYSLFLFLTLRRKKVQVIVQNTYDQKFVSRLGCSCEKINLIKGSGVNLSLYHNAEQVEKELIVLFPARLLADKGIFEFASVAKQLKKEYPHWRFIIAGDANYSNPSALTYAEAEELVLESNIEWIGYVTDMPELLMRTSIVCLPSYREGMPKVLLEASAAGCTIVTTDVIGCNEAILDKVSGELVPPMDCNALEACLRRLLDDSIQRQKYGIKARAIAVEEYSVDAVVEKTLSLYGI